MKNGYVKPGVVAVDGFVAVVGADFVGYVVEVEFPLSSALVDWASERGVKCEGEERGSLLAVEGVQGVSGVAGAEGQEVGVVGGVA